jgi:hypothetical protein
MSKIKDGELVIGFLWMPYQKYLNYVDIRACHYYRNIVGFFLDLSNNADAPMLRRQQKTFDAYQVRVGITDA